jgi:hypothetical protein
MDEEFGVDEVAVDEAPRVDVVNRAVINGPARISRIPSITTSRERSGRRR